MPISNLVRRQQPQVLGERSSDNTNSTNLPTYVWVLVVAFIALTLSCAICARRARHRQFLDLYRQAGVNPQNRPTAVDRNPSAPPWTSFSRTSADHSGLQPPPRARRRGSQASVTSLPVYMENPGAQEVVLLQRAIPKDEDGTAPPARQPIVGGAEANLPANSGITPSQPISVSPAPISQSARTTVNRNPSLPGYQHSAVPVPPAPSSPGSHPPTSQPLSDARPSLQL